MSSYGTLGSACAESPRGASVAPRRVSLPRRTVICMMNIAFTHYAHYSPFTVPGYGRSVTAASELEVLSEVPERGSRPRAAVRPRRRAQCSPAGGHCSWHWRLQGPTSPRPLRPPGRAARFARGRRHAPQPNGRNGHRPGPAGGSDLASAGRARSGHAGDLRVGAGIVLARSTEDAAWD